MSATMTLRMNESQKRLIREYAESQDVTMSEFVLNAALDVIEDAIDAHDADLAYAEYLKNPVSYTSAEIEAKYL